MYIYIYTCIHTCTEYSSYLEKDRAAPVPDLSNIGKVQAAVLVSVRVLMMIQVIVFAIVSA